MSTTTCNLNKCFALGPFVASHTDTSTHIAFLWPSNYHESVGSVRRYGSFWCSKSRYTCDAIWRGSGKSSFSWICISAVQLGLWMQTEPVSSFFLVCFHVRLVIQIYVAPRTRSMPSTSAATTLRCLAFWSTMQRRSQVEAKNEKSYLR